MDMPVVIAGFSLTPNMVEPWAEAGCECYCVDTEHPVRVPKTIEHGAGLIHFVYGDARYWTPPPGVLERLIALFFFPVCTHGAVSGARDHQIKGPFLGADYLQTLGCAFQIAGWTGKPTMIEQPITVAPSYVGKPDGYVHPWQFAGYCADDNYTKNTALWLRNGMRMPIQNPATDLLGEPDHRIHEATPSPDRDNFRSETPRGLSRATFEANKHLIPSDISVRAA